MPEPVKMPAKPSAARKPVPAPAPVKKPVSPPVPAPVKKPAPSKAAPTKLGKPMEVPVNPKPAAKPSKKNYDYYEREEEPVTWYDDDYFSDEDDYPVYPHEASIYYDARNNYDIYYDPYYEDEYDDDHYDDMYLDDDAEHYYSEVFPEEHLTYGHSYEDEPFVREEHRRPRQRRNQIMENETPMYVRPYLEDPLFLQPDD